MPTAIVKLVEILFGKDVLHSQFQNTYSNSGLNIPQAKK
jgi:hypothetical protein